MTLLLHGSDRVSPSSDVRATAADAVRAHLPAIKRLCLTVFVILLAGGALAGVIALKTAIYFWRFGFH